MNQPFVMSLLFVLGLLLVGFVLRAGIRPLRTLFVPASVVGGLIGLLVMQAGLRVGPGEPVRTSGDLTFLLPVDPPVPMDDGVVHGDINVVPPAATQQWSAEISNVIDGWPGLLIAVVFAGLLMERPGKRFGEAMTLAARQGIVVWIIVFGEAFVGLLAMALLISPFYPELPRAFGQLIETGFAGGHGTAAAMGSVFETVFNFPLGRDIAFLFATVGLVYGVISGIFFVNLGVRRGWLRRRPGSASTPPQSGDTLEYESRPPTTAIDIPVVSGLEARHDPTPSAFARVRNEVIDPFAFQLCILAIAFAVGYALQWLFLVVADVFATDRAMEFVGNVPLFLFTLIGGWLTREAFHLTGFGDLIDPPSIHRLTGIAMELLIVAALTTLRIEAAVEYLWPILILLLVGFAWTAFCLVYVSRKLLPQDYWFELGLLNYGMSTATTAQGVLLLRIVDRNLETGAAEDYAAAAPLSAPFIGGGVLTVLVIPMALNWGGFWPVLAVMAVMLVALAWIGIRLRRAGEHRA